MSSADDPQQTKPTFHVTKTPYAQKNGADFGDEEDPLAKEMATHSSILFWEIPWSEEPGAGYSPWNHKRVGHT